MYSRIFCCGNTIVADNSTTGLGYLIFELLHCFACYINLKDKCVLQLIEQPPQMVPLTVA